MIVERILLNLSHGCIKFLRHRMVICTISLTDLMDMHWDYYCSCRQQCPAQQCFSGVNADMAVPSEERVPGTMDVGSGCGACACVYPGIIVPTPHPT